MIRSMWVALVTVGLALPALAQQQEDVTPPPQPAPDQVDPAQPPTDVEQPRRPEPAGPVDPLIEEPPAVDPLREPLQEPPRAVPPAPGIERRRAPGFTRDPGYVAPQPEPPQITIEEIVRNPIRIHEARRLVLTGGCAGAAAIEGLNILATRFPTDARVRYLRYILLSRIGDQQAALVALREAVELERLYPVPDYDVFMEPIQGPDRFYAERVRRAVFELARAESLVEPDVRDVIPEPATAEPPLPAEGGTFSPTDDLRQTPAPPAPRAAEPVPPPPGAAPPIP